MRLSILLLSVILVACSGKPPIIIPQTELMPERKHEISVVSHGWHTGLIIAGPILNSAIPELEKRFGVPLFYEIGWGDKGFYQAQTITAGLTLQAMFWSSGVVLHIVALNEIPTQYFAGEPLETTCLSAQELASLMQFLAASFARAPDGSLITLRNGIYGDSQFYGAEGRYYLLNTCNKWTAKALRSSGLAIQPASKLTAGSVMDFLKQHRQACAHP